MSMQALQRVHFCRFTLPVILSFGLAIFISGCPTVGPPAGCTTDAECDDTDACTTDTCDTDTGLCANALVDTAVQVSTSTSGDAIPGATVSASADVTICDGSTVMGYAWTQSNSVSVGLTGADTDTVSVALPGSADFKAELILALTEPPVGEEQLPGDAPLPEAEFHGGLPDRFQVAGINPFALEEAGHVGLQVEVTTSSGTYGGTADIHTHLPWAIAAGIRNVPTGISVLMYGKNQDSYSWSLDGPAGSAATLADAATQSPYFTPDVPGSYELTVTDLSAEPPADVTIEMIAGTWTGVITGQDADGRPLADNCTTCHNGGFASDTFTPWAQTGHAEIFTDNLNTSTHYSTGCLSCHSVGYDPAVDNGGFDDASDWDAFLAEFTTDGSHFHPDANNWNNMLANEPASAQLSNIQCENCHGPQASAAHMTGSSRIDLSSDVCATCHGEPLRHARFQQWQLSGHSNYELAVDEGSSGNCSRCHTGNGFLAWLPILLDDDPNTDPAANITVDWALDDTHPQTCVTCHDPHDIGTTTGIDTDATVRISGDTPPLIAGFTATDVGRGAICMTCHNSRRGLRNDDTFADNRSDAARAPHGSSQTDVLMGENAYLVNVGVRGAHSVVEDACVMCHMESTPPPDLLSYNLGGTNHTFFAKPDICADCHGAGLTADGIQGIYDSKASKLKGLIEGALLALITEQIAAGNSVEIRNSDGSVALAITDAATIASIDFGEYHGRQSMTVTGTDDAVTGPSRMNDVYVVDGAAADLGELYDFATDALIKAGWNYNLGQNDGSKSVHNPSFVVDFLDASIDALEG